MSELLPEGRALRDALDAYDREELLYATKYAAEHGELPPGFRKCEECARVILPGEYHRHERIHTGTPLDTHLDHVYMSYGDWSDSSEARLDD